MKRLIHDIVVFYKAMGSLPWTIQLWASLYPLPQLLGGLYFIRETPGQIILFGRVSSFVLASQVHRYRPFSKLIGPLSHSHWLLILPYLFYALVTQTLTQNLYWFIVYVCVTSLISWVIDTRDVVQCFKQGESHYKKD